MNTPTNQPTVPFNAQPVRQKKRIYRDLSRIELDWGEISIHETETETESQNTTNGINSVNSLIEECEIPYCSEKDSRQTSSKKRTLTINLKAIEGVTIKLNFEE